MTKITYIPGEIANAAIDEHGNRKPVTRTQHIFDDAKGKKQSEVNADVDNTLNQLSDEIDAVNTQDYVPVDTLPAVATADPKKIYRLTGETSYTDYMVNASGDGWKALATYEFPGIDDEPTVGSDNLVKSDGVAELYVKPQPIKLYNGYVGADGSVVNANVGWSRSGYILIDDVVGETIELNKGASSNPSGPAAAAIATYDAELNVVDLPNISGKTFRKSLFSSTAKYVMFSFYAKTDVVISNYAVREQTHNLDSRLIPIEKHFKQQEVVLTKGYVNAQGEVVNISLDQWKHSNYIDLDSVFDKTIILNKGTSANPSSPAIAPMAVYDSSYNLLYVSTSNSGKRIYTKEELFPSNSAKYVVFSFYNKSDVVILNTEVEGKIDYLNTKIDETNTTLDNKIDNNQQEVEDSIVKKPVTLVRGYVTKDTGVIVNGAFDNWYHSSPVLIDSCIGDFIKLSRGSNSNTSNPAVAGYATYDTNMQPVTVYNLGRRIVNKSEFGEGSKYIVFSFYTSDLNIYVLNASIHGSLELAFSNIATNTENIASLDTRVSALEEDVPDAGIVGRNIYRDAAVRGTGTKAVTSDIKPLSFIHISDIHTKSDNYKCFENACEFYQNYANIAAMIVTGDIVWDTYADATTWYNLALQKTTKPVLNVIGNHDAGQYNPEIGLGSQSSDLECYNKFIAPYVSNWGVVQPTNASTDGKSYYYKDFTDEKVRLIVLCEYETDYEINQEGTGLVYSREWRAMRQAQVTWLINTLTNTPSDYGVIVAYHQPDPLKDENNAFVSFDLVADYRIAHGMNPTALVYCDDKEWLPKILNAYATKSSLSLTVTQTGAVVESSPTLVCDCDFTNIQSEFICILTGHTHRDYIGHLKNFPSLSILCVGADNLRYTSTFQPRAEGTPSEDLFNVVNIDRNRKTIKIIRIGSDASVTGQVRDQMIMSYATT